MNHSKAAIIVMVVVNHSSSEMYAKAIADKDSAYGREVASRTGPVLVWNPTTTWGISENEITTPAVDNIVSSIE